MQDPLAGRADEHVPSGHEQLLQQAQGAGAHFASQQEGQQDGDPPARHRLHLGPPDRTRLTGHEPSASGFGLSHATDNPQRGAKQHLCRGKKSLKC